MSGVTVTDSTFDNEVVKSATPVLVDFWAVWCVAPDTQIYTSQFDSKKAEKIHVGDNLLGWKKRLETGTVSYSQTTKDGGHCQLLKTISGRKLKVTGDHLVFTRQGWKKAREIQVGDDVAVLPVREPMHFVGRDKVIVAEIAVQAVAKKSMRISSYLNDLKNKGLLPLKENCLHILTLARLAGALFTDGSLYQGKNNYRETSFTLGRREDAEEVIGDLVSLGFKKVHLKERMSNGQIGKRKFKQHSFRVKCLSTSLYLLLRALGVPEGSKFSQKVSLPSWINLGTTAIKREFLAAILGGDGPKLDMVLAKRENKLPYNKLLINDYEFHKEKNLADSGKKFAQELSFLLEEFGVHVRKIFIDKDNYLRKDGKVACTVHLAFSSDFETGFALAHKLGYIYCRTKEESAAIIGEFLRIILEKRNTWQSFYKKALKLYKQGISAKTISQKLGLSYDTVFGWVRLSKKATVPYHLLKFTKWVKETTRGFQDGFLWQEIVKNTTIYLPAVQRITVEKTHNFIANGFLVHNCGPCRMQDPILDEIFKDYEGKVKLAKLNVDENPQMAQKYGVMSIPTLLLFKNGEIVKQMIGVQSKETLEEEFKKVVS